jgi:prefoldin subunit 4
MDVPVRKNDQENISSFSVLSGEVRSLKAELKELEEEKVLLGDVEDEVLLTEDLRAGEGMFFRIGDTFVEMEDDKFTQAIEQEKEKVSERLSVVHTRIEEIQNILAGLKVELYARFRDQIALDM